MRFSSHFLRRFRRDSASAPRIERVLAISRAFLTVTALGAIYLDATEPARLATLAYSMLAAYAAYSLAVLAWVHRAARVAPAHSILLHGLDILWSSALTAVSEGAVSPFFLFFLFAVVAAAYRWGFMETVATAVVVILVFLVETAAASASPWSATWLPMELNRTILRVAYLLLTGVLVGYLAEQDKNSRAELAAIANAARQPRLDLGLGGSVAAVAQGLLETFEAHAVAIVLKDGQSGRTLLWRLDRRGAGDQVSTLRLELNPSEQGAWLFAPPARVWRASFAGPGAALVSACQPGIWPLRKLKVDLPRAVAEAWDCRTVTAADLILADDWSGRIYLYDVPALDGLERGLHFLEALTDQIGSGLTNVLLLRRLKSQATTAERARVARELHDGAIQSLLGIEMNVEALRRDTLAAGQQSVGNRLSEIQVLLQREVLAIRELMQALKPVEIDGSHQLPDVIASIVERFRRDAGVSARFVTSGQALPMPAATALEIVRIVQEALVNVRRHSRASNVLVRLTNEGQQCRLVVEDDGCGFGFSGLLTLAELDRLKVGPAIIKERARLAGADLVIDSRPGAGARIELSIAGSHG